MIEEFANSLTAPPKYVIEVTPADGSDLAQVCKCLYVGGTGDVAVQTEGNPSGYTITNVQQGGWLGVPGLTRILSTGTTATNILSGYDKPEAP